MPELTTNTNGAAPQETTLERIERRLARIERALERLDHAERSAPGTLAMAVDTFDDVAARMQTRGVDLDERMRTAMDMLERLTAPETAKALDRAMAAATQLPAAVATAVDVADSIAERVQASGVDIDERLRVLTRVAERLTAPEALATLEVALDQMHGVRSLLLSGVLDPAPVAMIARAGKALAEAGSRDAPKVGAFGALRSLGDPSVQRALGFLLQVARLFGAELETNEVKALLSAKEGK